MYKKLIESVARAKALPVWDSVPHALHKELDALFKLVEATKAPTVYTLVPVEPTEEMCKSASVWGIRDPRVAEACYMAMLQAAPAPIREDARNGQAPIAEQPQLTNEELLPCPFCGSGMIVPVDDDMPLFSCLACHASTPKHVWNTRAILAAQKSTEWISVDDRLPDEDGLYLTMVGSQRHISGYNGSTMTGPWWMPYGLPRKLAKEPTHWMPLPKAPTPPEWE